MENTKIISPCAEMYWIEKNNILFTKFTSMTNLDGAKKHVSLMQENFIKDNGPLLCLTDVKNTKEKGSREVRQYFDSDFVHSLTRANAIVVGSGISRTIINLVLKFSKQNVPTKIFTNEEKALEWLKEFDN